MNQKGFTLVELAIVLVIIGVILGGVIKGQELVTNAKIKRLYRDFQQVEFAHFSYQDRYNEVAGDGTGTGDNAEDGLIDDGASKSRFNSSTTGTEATIFWNDQREAGFFSDGEKGTDIPNHVFGGNITVNSKQYGFSKNVVCLADLEAEDAEILDAQFDDGDATSGNIRSDKVLSTDTPTSAYDNESADKYISCITLD